MTLRDRMLLLAKSFQEKAENVDTEMITSSSYKREMMSNAYRLFATRLLLEIKEHDEQ